VSADAIEHLSGSLADFAATSRIPVVRNRLRGRPETAALGQKSQVVEDTRASILSTLRAQRGPLGSASAEVKVRVSLQDRVDSSGSSKIRSEPGHVGGSDVIRPCAVLTCPVIGADGG
jgi:hypothetical protein